MIDGDDVVHELELGAAPTEVFDFFVDPAKLIRWIGITADLDPRPGGRFRFEIVPGEFCEGAYVEVDRPRRIVFSWGWSNSFMGVAPATTTVEVTFTAVAAGTRLRLVHHGLGAGPPRDMHDEGWTRFLAQLATVVATR